MPDLVPFQRGRSLLSPARFDDFFGVLDEFFSPNARSRTWRDTFKLDVRENEKEYCLDAELPG